MTTISLTHRLGICGLVASALMVVVRLAAAEPSLVEPPYWRALREAKYEPTPADRLEQKQAEIYEALQQLEGYLRLGGPEVVDGWQQYLRWPELQKELASPQPDPTLLGQVFLALRCNQAGVENLPFVAVRDRLHEYLLTTRFRGPRDPAAAFAEAIGQLQVLLARYERAPTRQDARAISSLLACLDRSGPSARAAVAAIRQQYDQPNALARISQRFLTYMIPRQIGDRQTAIHETKDRVTTRGTAVTSIEAAGQMVPDQAQGSVDIQISALTRAPHTVSTAGPVTVHGAFVARTQVHKRVSLEEDGLTFQPARARGTASVTIKDVMASRRLVESIGQRRANRRLPETEEEIAESSAAQIEQIIDQEVERVLADANRVYQGDLRNPMLRYGAFPEQFQLSSSRSFLQLLVKLAKSAQLAAPGPLPALDAEHDLAFVLHASFLENFAELTLGGKSIRDEQWLNFMGILTGNQPRPLWVHDRSPPWSFGFAERYPIQVVLQDGHFTLTVRGQSVRRGSQVVTRPVQLVGRYGVIQTPDGAAFVRQGQLQVGWSDGGASADEAERKMLAFVGRKFQGILQPTIYFDSFVPPAGSQFAKLRDFQLAQFDFRDDWVTIGYQLARPDGETLGGAPRR
ncbi:MAG: hypothetical protein GTO03_06005 [Planctomycetales bacterium]|nr:hypothetical protein [Planctomycetales bacterium]